MEPTCLKKKLIDEVLQKKRCPMRFAYIASQVCIPTQEHGNEVHEVQQLTTVLVVVESDANISTNGDNMSDITEVMAYDENSGENQYLTFMLDGEEYGVDILSVQEIKGWEGATPIPNTPEYVKGVVNLRGSIVPVIDMRQRFGLEFREYDELTVIIVLRVYGKSSDSRILGIIVDAVSEVYDFPEDSIQPPPEMGSKVGSQFLKGLATEDESMVILLETEHLLDLDQMLLVDEMVEQQGDE